MQVLGQFEYLQILQSTARGYWLVPVVTHFDPPFKALWLLKHAKAMAENFHLTKIVPVRSTR